MPRDPRNRNSDVSVSIMLYDQFVKWRSRTGAFFAILILSNQSVNIRIKRQASKNLDFYKKFFSKKVPHYRPALASLMLET